MMQFVKSLDGETVIGGVSLKDHTGEPNWYAVIHRTPEPAEDETTIVIGYEREGDGFAPIYKYVKQPKVEPMKYSARSILRELRELGKYEAFRALLTQIGYDWEFLSANYLAEDDADFKRLKSAVVDAGIVGSMTELDAMLAKCLWTAE